MMTVLIGMFGKALSAVGFAFLETGKPFPWLNALGSIVFP
jgi:hypothetical protein